MFVPLALWPHTLLAVTVGLCSEVSTLRHSTYPRAAVRRSTSNPNFVLPALDPENILKANLPKFAVRQAVFWNKRPDVVGYIQCVEDDDYLVVFKDPKTQKVEVIR